MLSIGRQSREGRRVPRANYVLRLYVAGATPRSAMAIANVRQMCRERLGGHCELRVIDICQEPKLAIEAQIIGAPTLVKKLPLPVATIIGDFSNVERVMSRLNLVPTDRAPA